jgi:predicted amidophosphoribosyltransferase
VRDVLDVVFPLVCPGCGRAGAPVCGRCSTTLRPPAPAPAPAGVDAWCAPFAYEGVAREVVARVKYRGARAAAPWLADAMARTLLDDVLGGDPRFFDALRATGALTWAPTSRARRRARGFDQAEVLARAVGRRLGMRAVALLERGAGPPQTGRSAAARRVGPRFEARRRAAGVPCVIVVDDVATTGSTLSAAALALRGSGTRTVVALTASRR